MDDDAPTMTETSSVDTTRRPIEGRFRDAIDAINRQDLDAVDRLVELYDPYVVFQDPVQTVYGRDEFRDANERLVRRAHDLHMNLAAFFETEEHLFSTWTFSFSPRIGPRLNVEGSTHAQLRDGFIIYQRDYWDLAGSVVDAIPAVGLIYRRISRLLT